MKILVVEDDVLVAQTLSAVLTNQNYAIEVASDGEVAWDLIQAFDYDLILLDVILPKLDGITLCRQIRSAGLRMPILLLTGCNSSHEKAIGLDAGADDYLVKPFDQEELVARIRALLRRGTLASQPILEWDNLRLDPISCEVTYGEQELSLTPKEYALLELFLRNSRRVFSCGMILEHLWSYEDTPGEEAVRTHIKGLRMKLKAVGASADLIETVYGIGYRLKPQENGENKKIIKGRKSKHRKASEELGIDKTTNSTSQQTLLAIAGVWNRYQDRVEKQITILEVAAKAVMRKALSPKLRQQAQQEAHSLAGSLGTFGFPIGSNLAKQIEQTLKNKQDFNKADATQLISLVNQLRQEIEQKQEETTSSTETEADEQPLLLVVDSDSNLAANILQESAHRGIKVAIATDIPTARNKLYREHPNVVLLDPSVSDSHEDSFDLLGELKNRKPPVPVIVFTQESDFSNRLEVARNGGHTFLQKPMAIPEVMDTVTQVLQHAPHAEAHILAVDDDPKIGAVLQALLQPWGIKVTSLTDPQRFWETLEVVDPDLLILDVEMPEVNGLEVCQVVRNDPRWSELPIVFLTVHKEADIIDQVFAAGADDFVSKPIIGPELVTRIVNRLERIKLRQHMAQTQENKIREITEKNSNHQQQQTLLTQETEQALRKAEELELIVAERTSELRKINEQLQSELNERQRAQEALRDSQARLAGIVEIADDAIISIDSDQRITLFNKGAEKIFGYQAQEVLGQPLDLLLPSRYINSHRHYVADFGNSAKVARPMGERREIFGLRKDGTEFPAEASISKLKLRDETVYTVYLQDISDRKYIERMKDEFISVTSHELRTPLTSIHGSLGMLASGMIPPDSEQGKRLLQIAVDSTERLVRLINDILDIERIESGKVKMEKQTCKVEELITEAVNVIQPLADKAGVILSIDSIPEKLWVDPDRIVQTLTNLLSNAVKFSHSAATVYLSAEVEEIDIPENSAVSPNRKQILFKVQDSGRGIPEDKIDTIFERFQQADSSDSRNHEGTGLGLAICKSIVQQHRGHIWVESKLGEGSTFYFTLPMLPSPRSSITPDGEELDDEISPSVHLPLVLVCDDDAQVCQELENLLEKRRYRVVTADSGETAIAVAAQQHPDVILLDLLMPGMNGWEVMAVLKERTDTRDIPIIICSICTPSDSSKPSTDFVDWVSKPLEETLLFQSLSQVLAQSSRPVRVLVVEDDTNTAEILTTLLKSHDIETSLASTGREAIRLSQEVKPDLLILDLSLPEGDGFDVVEWLQQHNKLNNIPLVVYSAKDLNESERQRLKLGHTEFLTKGRVTTQEFEQRVMGLIQRITQTSRTQRQQ
ncbi:MAG: response regulator [Nostocaceae cyanobacterium]|nr:response regulator [Nostocaceae cyanobacterium]